jgi:hypothetical protein
MADYQRGSGTLFVFTLLSSSMSMFIFYSKTSEPLLKSGVYCTDPHKVLERVKFIFVH